MTPGIYPTPEAHNIAICYSNDISTHHVMLMSISIHSDANRQGTGVAVFSVVSLEKQSTQTNRRAAEASTAFVFVATLHDGFQPALE